MVLHYLGGLIFGWAYNWGKLGDMFLTVCHTVLLPVTCSYSYIPGLTYIEIIFSLDFQSIIKFRHLHTPLSLNASSKFFQMRQVRMSWSKNSPNLCKSTDACLHYTMHFLEVNFDMLFQAFFSDIGILFPKPLNMIAGLNLHFPSANIVN